MAHCVGVCENRRSLSAIIVEEQIESNEWQQHKNETPARLCDKIYDWYVCDGHANPETVKIERHRTNGAISTRTAASESGIPPGQQ